MERKRVKLQGLYVDTFTMDEALDYIKSGQIVTINPEMIEYAAKDKDFAEIVRNAELLVPDGIGVQLGLKILGHDVKRIAGIELGKKLLCKYSGAPVAFIGAKPDVVAAAVEKIKGEIPNLNAVCVLDGYFKDSDTVLNDLKNSCPKLALIALGSPKQEFFIAKAKKMLPDTIFIGLGGSFDVWSGRVERAPQIWQRFGLEWLYRTIKEPKRFKRIFPVLPVFVLKVFREKLIGA